MADSGYKSISRTHNPGKKMFGWQVRVAFKGQLYTKFFNENFYGGPEQALKEALKYRDELEKQLGKPRSEDFVPGDNPRSRIDNPIVRRSRRTTGTYVAYTNTPRYSDVFEVVWSTGAGKRQTRTYSINKYGEKEAYRLACETKDKVLAEIRERRRG